MYRGQVSLGLRETKQDRSNGLTRKNSFNLSLAFALSAGTGETLSSKSYTNTSDDDDLVFSSILSEDEGT